MSKKMRLEYYPNLGFKVNSIELKWGEDRKAVRNKLKNRHEEDDQLRGESTSNRDDIYFDVERRRDIYEDVDEGTNYFFIGYNKQGKLSELEVHWGINLFVEGVDMMFDSDINTYVERLESNGHSKTELEKGNYFFEALKMTLADSEATGETGNGLSYFYAGSNVDHLL